MSDEQAAASRPTSASEFDRGRRLAITSTRLLNDWGTAHRRALAYLDALGVPEAEQEALVAAAIERAVEAPWAPDSDAITETLRAVRAIAVRRDSRAARRDGFLAWRLARIRGPDGTGSDEGADAPLPFVPQLDR